MGKRSGSSKPVWFDGQKSMGRRLFARGGMLDALMKGGPSPAFEAMGARSTQALNQQLTQQGIQGSPLAMKSHVNLQGQIGVGREQHTLETLLSAIQPPGTKSSSGAGGVFTK